MGRKPKEPKPVTEPVAPKKGRGRPRKSLEERITAPKPTKKPKKVVEPQEIETLDEVEDLEEL